MSFPRLRLRDEVASLLDLPWELPLARWSDPAQEFRDLPVGPSRHLVRFLVHDGIVYALKELPAAGGDPRVRASFAISRMPGCPRCVPWAWRTGPSAAMRSS